MKSVFTETRVTLLRTRLRSEFLRNVFTLATGTTIAQFIPLLAAPILSRLFSPADYGLMALFSSVAGLLAIAATGMYAPAVILAKDNREAANLLVLATGIALIFSLVILALVVIFHQALVTMLHNPEISPWLYLVPVSVFLSGLLQGLTNWSNRRQQYKRLATNRVAGAVTGTGVQIAAGAAQAGGGGLIVGLLSGLGVSTALLGGQTWREDRANLKEATPAGMRLVARAHRRFPIYVLTTEFINVATNQVPIFVLNSLANAASVGLYGMTQRVLGLPSTLIANSITDVFKQRAASDYLKYDNCRDIYRKTFKLLLALAIVPFGLLFLFGPELFGFVFGERWAPAGEYTRYLSIMFFFGFVSSPLSYVYYIAGRQREDLLLHIYMMFSTLVALSIGYAVFHEPRYMILAFSINYALIYLVYLVRSYSFSKGRSPARLEPAK
jgi:O-antigen/teichoic acid export membrane protein